MQSHKKILNKQKKHKKLLLPIITFVLSIIFSIIIETNRLYFLRSGNLFSDIVTEINPNEFNASNNNKLILATGYISTDSFLLDNVFKIEEQALILKRIVEMFQWKEVITNIRNKDNINDYSKFQNLKHDFHYEKIWSNNHINSKDFKDKLVKNPDHIPFGSKLFTNRNINLGLFGFSKEFRKEMEKILVKFKIDKSYHDVLNPRIGGWFKHNKDHFFYGDKNNPTIGSLRVSFEILPEGIYTIVGKQNNYIIEPYILPNGQIAIIKPGEHDKYSIFTINDNYNLFYLILTWLVAYIILVFGSYYLISSCINYTPELKNNKKLTVKNIFYLSLYSAAFILNFQLVVINLFYPRLILILFISSLILLIRHGQKLQKKYFTASIRKKRASK